jgi:hypothetical protein
MSRRLIRRVLRRARHLQPGELPFRVRETARSAVEAWRFARGEDWDPAALVSRLADRPELDDTRRALKAGDSIAAHAAFHSHFRARPPRFLLEPTDRRRLVAAIQSRFPSAREEAAHRATRILEGRLDLLGYTDLSVRTAHGAIDWHSDPVHQRRAPLVFWQRVPFLDPQIGDHKIIWELNRHQHWLTLGRAAWLTGDGRYSAAVVRELHDWLRSNPPLTGINWASMLELAFRCLSWIWALHFLLGEEDQAEVETGWLVALLLGLDRQLEHISGHLSLYFSPNTHLLGEALSLYVAGRVLPELASAPRWEDVGRRVLIEQIASQVLPDGGHVERSLHYHRYTLDFYLLALAIARRTRDPAADRFAEAVTRLAWFCRSMADENGRLPRIGDDDGGALFPICGRKVADASDSLSMAATLLGRGELAIGPPPEEVFWMLGSEASTAPRTHRVAAIRSQLFEETGYAVLRRSTSHAIVDVGRHGFLNGGHAHADALSMVVTAEGTPLLIDPGTATYTMDREARDRFRSTPMHNTVVLDRRPQSLADGPFHWRTQADARVECWRSGRAFDYVEASHDGYLPALHRRAVFSLDGWLWIVADHLFTEGDHTADVYWHFDPMWDLQDDSGRLAAPRGSTGVLYAAVASNAAACEALLDDAAGIAVCSPNYGLVRPSPALRFSTNVHGHATILSAIAAGRAPVRVSLETVRVTKQAEGCHVAAAAIRLNDRQLLAAFATTPPEHDRPPAVGYCFQFRGGVVDTDARALVLRFDSSGEPCEASIVDGSRLVATGAWPLAIEIPHPAADLHLDLPALRRLSRRETVTTIEPSAG